MTREDKIRELAAAVGRYAWREPWEEGVEVLTAPTADYIDGVPPDQISAAMDVIAAARRFVFGCWSAKSTMAPEGANYVEREQELARALGDALSRWDETP